MARLKLGSIVGDISGKVGSEIYSRNKGGPYVKAWAAPNITPTFYTNTYRSFFADAVALYNSIDDAYFKNLQSFAQSFKKSTFHNGAAIQHPRDFFLSVAMNRRLCGITDLPEFLNPPDHFFSSFLVTLSDSPSMVFSWLGEFTENQFAIILYGSFPANFGVRSFNTVRQIPFTLAFPPFENDINVLEPYLTRFNLESLVPGMKYFFTARVIHIPSGLSTGVLRFKTILGSSPLSENLGNTDIRASNTAATNPLAIPVTPSFNGYINGIWLLNSSGSPSRTFGVYSDAGGVPGSLIHSTAPIMQTLPDSWEFYNFGTSIPVLSGVTYWLAVQGSFPAQVKTSGSPIFAYRRSSSFSGLPATFGAGALQSYGFSCYVVNTES